MNRDDFNRKRDGLSVNQGNLNCVWDELNGEQAVATDNPAIIFFKRSCLSRKWAGRKIFRPAARRNWAGQKIFIHTGRTDWLDDLCKRFNA